MARLAYVNGRYVPHAQARVHVEDRGFQFADGVYEVVSILDGHMIDEDGHMARLDRSLRELRIDAPMGRRALALTLRTLIRRNRVHTGIIYLQATRGAAPRDFKFPKTGASTLVLTTRRFAAFGTAAQLTLGVPVITLPDIRWQRRDIKTVALTANVMGKQRAVEAGAFEAWQVDGGGKVTEGCSSNAWIVTDGGVVVTRQADTQILNGVTRLAVLRLAREAGFAVEERPFTVEEACRAREAFLTSASNFCLPITRIDGRDIGDGRPGPVALRLRQAYLDHARGPGRASLSLEIPALGDTA